MLRKIGKKVVSFAKAEEGYIAESVTWTSILGLGAATISFGLYGAFRFQSGGAIDDMKAIMTSAKLPTATESVNSLSAGYTGAITGMEITEVAP